MPEPGTIPVLMGLAVSWGNNIKQGDFSERVGGDRCSRDVLSKGRGVSCLALTQGEASPAPQCGS